LGHERVGGTARLAAEQAFVASQYLFTFLFITAPT
jgi:hypothetical protein